VFSYSVFLFALIISVHTNHLKSDQNVHPNVGEITSEYKKMVKPFYQKEFFPQEVDSIRDAPIKAAYNFQNAEIVGGSLQKSSGMNEKPTIYETVITRRGTSVLHPIQKMGSQRLSNADALYFQDPTSDFPVRKIKPGQYAIPVHLETSSRVFSEANQKGYEIPAFKAQDEFQRMAGRQNNFEDQIFMTQIKEDANRITSKARKTKGTKNKIKVLKRGQKDLEKDAKRISDGIQKEVANLVGAKQTAIQMNNVFAKYELKLKKSQLSRLKLSDVITIKKKLVKKLAREIQGFRTASANYAELSKVNSSEIKRIVKKKKKKLKY